MNDGLRVVVLSVFITLVLTSAAMAAVTDFEGFTTGTSVNGQGGWSVEDSFGHDNADSGKPAYDEAVTDDGTGNTAWRVSNAVTDSGYSAQPFSHVAPQVAGETGSSLWNDYGTDHTQPYSPPHFGANAEMPGFYASFDFKSATGAAQPGLSISVSPSAKQSAVRLSYLNISDNGNDGFDLLFYDTSNGDNGWNPTTVATGLSYTDWHTVEMAMEFVDGVDTSAGQIDGNDLVNIFVNGVPVHTGTTWESYYYTFGEGVPEPRLQAVDSLLFRMAGTAAPDTMGYGFYFDNIHVSSVPEPASLLLLSLGGLYLLLPRRRSSLRS